MDLPKKPIWAQQLQKSAAEAFPAYRIKKRKHLSESDKETCALLLMARGRQELTSDNSDAFDTLARARRLAPSDVSIQKGIAHIFAGKEENIRCLTQAHRGFQQAQAIGGEDSLEDLVTWAKVLARLGVYFHSAHYLQESCDKFQEAFSMNREKKVMETLPAEFFWSWGKSWLELSLESGEALDIRHAIDKFAIAEKQGLDQARFWESYGRALFHLGVLVRRVEHVEQAVEFFELAMDCPSANVETCQLLSSAYRRLFELSRTMDCLDRVDRGFQEIIQREMDCASVWLEWGRLYLVAAKLLNSVEFAEASMEKLEAADICQPRDGEILSVWAEAELVVGICEDDLSALKLAEDKAKEAVEYSPDRVDCWGVYGSILNELGRYFRDERYYLRALEALRKGLSIDENASLLWYGAALSHFAIGDLRGDVEEIKRSALYCERVVSSGGGAYPQFWNDWGVALLRLAEMTNEHSLFLEAADKFAEALELVPEGIEPDIEWLYNYGCALDFLGDYDPEGEIYAKAVSILEQVVEKEPSFTQARYNLALSLYHLGETVGDPESYRRSFQLFEELYEKDPEDELVLHDWGTALMSYSGITEDPALPQFGEPYLKLAEERLYKAVQLGNLPALYTLACLYSMKKDYVRALEFLEKAREMKVIPSAEEMESDEWISGVRGTKEYQLFLERL